MLHVWVRGIYFNLRFIPCFNHLMVSWLAIVQLIIVCHAPTIQIWSMLNSLAGLVCMASKNGTKSRSLHGKADFVNFIDVTKKSRALLLSEPSYIPSPNLIFFFQNWWCRTSTPHPNPTAPPSLEAPNDAESRVSTDQSRSAPPTTPWPGLRPLYVPSPWPWGPRTTPGPTWGRPCIRWGPLSTTSARWRVSGVTPATRRSPARASAGLRRRPGLSAGRTMGKGRLNRDWLRSVGALGKI